MYTVILAQPARRALRALPVRDEKRILTAVQALANNPRPTGCLKLSGSDLWRIRVGQYRVVYEIADDELIIRVVRVGHRRDVYR